MPYICPLTQQEIHIPIMTNHGITYEFTAIAKAILLQETALDPQNNLPITSLTLNRALLNDTSISKYITPQIAQIVCALNTKKPGIKLYQFELIPDLELQIKILRKGKSTILAAKNGEHEKIVRFLPLLESKLNVMKTIACESLIAAVRNNQIRVVQVLLSTIHLKPNYTDEFGHTALSQAVSNGHIDIMHLLLTDSRVDPNLSNVFGETPLHFAAQKGHREIVQALLLHPSIEPNECNIFDETALFVALKHNHFEIVSLLLTDLRILDYCIIKLVREPELMHNVLLSYQPLILNLLIYKNTIWNKLREASHLGLTRDEHVQLLKDILDSQYKPVKHPLYALLIASSSMSIFSTDVIYQEMQSLISHSDQQTITAFTMT